jgi:hypothetical protein
MHDSPAVVVALAQINAWSNHDWETTRKMLATSVHALVTSTQPEFGGSEFTGVDNYMTRKMRGAQMSEPGSVRVLSGIGDERNALVVATMRITAGSGGTLVTMVRACLYALDEHQKINNERDQFFVLSECDERDHARHAAHYASTPRSLARASRCRREAGRISATKGLSMKSRTFAHADNSSLLEGPSGEAEHPRVSNHAHRVHSASSRAKTEVLTKWCHTHDCSNGPFCDEVN